MGLIIRMSLRNLFRQKRRSVFLGAGIAFGMMILVVASSFSHGLVDVIIQDIVSHSFGHLVIEAGLANSEISIIRDKERIEKVIYETIREEDIIEVKEKLATFGRAVGRGESDYIVVIGVTVEDTDKARDEIFHGFFTLVEGNFNDFHSKELEYPIIISEQKANSLNVGLHDVIKVRIPMVTGQIQTALFTVVAIANANNRFMDIITCVDGQRLKKLLGYQPWESAALQITLRDPKTTAVKYADKLHSRLNPELLSIMGRIKQQEVQLLAFQNNIQAKEDLAKHITIINGHQEKAFGRDGVMVSKKTAENLGLKVGDRFTFEYNTKFRGEHKEDFLVDAIFASDTQLGENIILVNEERIHNTYNRFLPANTGEKIFEKEDPLYSVLATEWELLDRTMNSEQLERKRRDARRTRTDQVKLDVVTMYEGASEILQLEGVLNLITIIAVLVLFFIILAGIMNTLGMTVKERTREIGTIRAIGMQKKDVRDSFLLETIFLTVISCAAGIILGLIVIRILGLINFDAKGFLSIILKNRRLYFKPNPAAIAGSFIFIVFIAGITAYFPSRRAANLSPIEALRHYE